MVRKGIKYLAFIILIVALLVCKRSEVKSIPELQREVDSLAALDTTDQDTSLPFFVVEVKPKPVYTPAPEYPEAARRKGIEGTAVIQAIIDTTGKICDAKIIKSSGNKYLDQAALEVGRTYHFTPGIMDGKVVWVKVQFPIIFRLK